MQTNALSARMAPPGARLASARPSAAAPPKVEDRFEASESSSALTWGKRVALAGLGMVALAGPAFAGAGPVGAAASAATRPAMSQTVEARPAAPAPLPALAASQAEADTVPARQEPEVGTRIEGHFVNDSYRDFLGVARERDVKPGTDDGDDNGWTHESRISVIRTEGDRQSVTTGRLQMVTERGSWEPEPGYGARRTDIWEFTHQHNFREHLDDRTDLLYGVGGGVQAVGPLGGRHIQEWFHDNISGGRIGAEQGLQTNYSTDHATFAPLVTGGVALRHRLDSDGEWHLKNSLEGALPLGPGLANIRAGSALEYRPNSRLTLDLGVGATASWDHGPALNFIDTDGVRPVAWAGAEYRLTDNISAFGRMDTGGIRDEPVYRMGITIHFGGGKAERAWLEPSWP